MSLIIAETVAEQPITAALLQAADDRIFPCFQARHVSWRYSLLSTDRQRMICTFEAPDAESVRDSYRRAGLPARPIWSGTRIVLAALPLPQPMQRYVVEATYPSLSQTDWEELNHVFLHDCAKHQLEALQAYLSFDRTKLVYELYALNGQSTQTVPHLLDLLGLHCDRFWLADVVPSGSNRNC